MPMVNSDFRLHGAYTGRTPRVHRLYTDVMRSVRVNGACGDLVHNS